MCLCQLVLNWNFGDELGVNWYSTGTEEPNHYCNCHKFPAGELLVFELFYFKNTIFRYIYSRTKNRDMEDFNVEKVIMLYVILKIILIPLI